MEKNPNLILSQIHEILSGSLPLRLAYNQYQKFGPWITTRNFKRVFEFSLEELSQRNKVQTLVDIIQELKTCPLNSEQVFQVKLLESLLLVIKKYTSIKLRINSLDDFSENHKAKKKEYLRTKENYSIIWWLDEKSREEAKMVRLQVIDTKQKLDDLKAKWLQVGFHSGCSQSDLMLNDIELSGLQNKHDRLMKLYLEKFKKCKELIKEKKQTSTSLKKKIMDSFDELGNSKEVEKELAYQELESIQRSWWFLRNATSSQA